MTKFHSENYDMNYIEFTNTLFGYRVGDELSVQTRWRDRNRQRKNWVLCDDWEDLYVKTYPAYPYVRMNGNVFYCHVLVLHAFHGPCPIGMEGCHNDGDIKNWRLDNLRWDTRSANIADSIRHGTRRSCAKFNESQAHDIYQKYASGEFTKAALASLYACSERTIYSVLRHVSENMTG